MWLAEMALLSYFQSGGAIALVEELDGVINISRDKLWAQAMLFACAVTNQSVTTSTEG